MSSNNSGIDTADHAIVGTAAAGSSNAVIDLVASVVSRYDLAVGGRSSNISNSNSSSTGGGGGGEAGIQRLLYIANKHPQTTVQLDCYRAIAHTCLRNGNFQRYRQVIGPGGSMVASSSLMLQQQQQQEFVLSYNANWVAEQETVYRQGRDVLQHRLQAAQSQLHKEAIRSAYLALANHDRRAGETVEAFHSLLRAKDYCTNRHQTTSVSLQIVEVCLLLQNYAAAGDYIHKLEHTIHAGVGAASSTSRGGAGGAAAAAASADAAAAPPVAADAATEVVKQKIQTAAALKNLAAGEYAVAAKKLAAAAISAASVSSSPLPLLSQPQASMASGAPGHEDERVVPAAAMMAARSVPPSASVAAASLTTVLAAEDVVMYAAFLTLCCGTAHDMIALAEHPEALELVPALREALLQFAVHCNYQKCWQLLQGGGDESGSSSRALPSSSCFEQLQYDLYMAPHVHALQQMIRERSIAEYWKAYQRVELVQMAQDLRGVVPNVTVLKELLVNLMLRHALDKDGTTRLNLTSLHRDEPSQPRLEQTSDMLRLVTQNVLNDVHAMTIRLACLEHDLQVTGGSGGGSGGDGGGGGSRRSSRQRGRGSGGHGHGGGGSNKLDYSDEEEDDDDHDISMVDAGEMNPEDLY